MTKKMTRWRGKYAKAPRHLYGKVYYDGHRVNRRTRAMLRRAEKMAGVKSLDISQGSYNNSVWASSGTHDGGGVVDIASSSWEIAEALRRAGFAAWVRSPSEGPWPYHIHAVAIGDRQLSPGARYQVAAYFNGRNGLADNAVDSAPKSVGRPFPNWVKSYR